MKYIYFLTEISNGATSYYTAERVPCDVDILHFFNNASRAGKTIHAYPCATWAEAQNQAREWNDVCKK